MKKILLIALAFIATSPLFAQNFTSGGINYSVTSATAPLTVKVNMNSYLIGVLNIPSTVTNAGTTYSVTSIGNNAFYQCINLTSVSIPSSVTSIGAYAFYQCTNLTSVSIPDSVISIGNDAFNLCYNLSSLTIPNSVTSIGAYAFGDCGNLTTLTIPNSVTSIGNAAFFRCSMLTSVIISNSVVSIGEQTFSGCSSLNSVSIPTSVTSIEGFAFLNCYGLTSVNIPAAVTNIGTYAFYGCSGLISVTVNWATPLAINANVFTDVTLSNVALNVPAGSLAAYQAAAVWNSFYSINGVLANDSFENTKTINLYPNPSNGIFNFQLANDLQIEVYNNLGQLLQSEKMFSGNNTINITDKAAGIYFLKANDGNSISTYKIIKN